MRAVNKTLENSIFCQSSFQLSNNDRIINDRIVAFIDEIQHSQKQYTRDEISKRLNEIREISTFLFLGVKY